MDLYGALPPPKDESGQPAPQPSSWHPPALQPPPRRPALAPSALLRPARAASHAAPRPAGVVADSESNVTRT